MALPWAAANAVLLDVCAPGQPDDANEVSDPGEAVWEGEAEAVLIRQNETVVEADANSPVEVDALVVRKPAEPVATAVPGDQGTGMTILVEDRRTDTPKRSRFRLTASEHRGKGEAESVRFELTDERAAA